MSFHVIEELPIEDQANIERIPAIPVTKRSAGETAYLTARADYLDNRIIAEDADGNISKASGFLVPLDGQPGFAKGAFFIERDAVNGVAAVYENVGTTTACKFVLDGGTPNSFYVTVGLDSNSNYQATAGIAQVAINQAITDVNAIGGGDVQPTRGLFTISDPIQERTKVNLRGAGKGITTIKAIDGYNPVTLNPGNGMSLLITVGTFGAIQKNTVSGITWDGNQANITPVTYANARHRMIWLADVTDFTFENCETLHPIAWTFCISAGDTVRIRKNSVYSGDYNYDISKLPDGGQDGFDITANNVWVEDNYIDTYGVATPTQRSSGDDCIVIRQGFGSQNCSNININRNILKSAARGVVCVVDEGLVSNVKMYRNMLLKTSGSGLFLEVAGATKTGSFANITMDDNTIVSAAELDFSAFQIGGAGIFVDPFGATQTVFQGLYITRNKILQTTYTGGNGLGFGIHIKAKGDDLVISGNTLKNIAGSRTISVGSGSFQVTNFKVDDNPVVEQANASSFAIVIDGASIGSVVNNKLKGPGTGTALRIIGRTGMTPQNVRVALNTFEGWTDGIKEEASGSTPDNNRYSNNTFISCSGTYTIIGPNSIIESGDGRRVFVSVVASGRTVSSSESGSFFSNEGASARVDFTLPTAVAGYEYTFCVQDADGIRVIASSGDTIRVAGSVSAAAGRIDNATIGSVVKIVSINATEWIAIHTVGTWTVT